MPLSNAQYDAIMYAYDERRNRNRHILEERKREVYTKIPEYGRLETELGNNGIAFAARLCDGDEDALAGFRKISSETARRKRELLVDNGFSPDYLDPIYTCSECRDTGYVGGAKCRCLKQAVIRSVYNRSNVEEILQRENFDNLSYEYYNDTDVEKMRQIIGECKAFAAEFDNRYENLLLNGTVGVGKTYLTNCIAKELLDTGHSVIYFTAADLFETLAGYAFRPYDASDEITSVHEDIFSCDLLIIDDLGTEMTNNFVVTQLFVILNERNLRKRSTLISTNLSLEALNEKYTERIFSRVYGYYKMLRIEIDDVRMTMKRIKNAQNRK